MSVLSATLGVFEKIWAWVSAKKMRKIGTNRWQSASHRRAYRFAILQNCKVFNPKKRQTATERKSPAFRRYQILLIVVLWTRWSNYRLLCVLTKRDGHAVWVLLCILGYSWLISDINSWAAKIVVRWAEQWKRWRGFSVVATPVVSLKPWVRGRRRTGVTALLVFFRPSKFRTTRCLRRWTTKQATWWQRI